jgi:TldD protein
MYEGINTRERQITAVNKSETYGIGVRALVGGSWGFAATRDLARESVTRTAKQAAAIAAANDKINPVKTTLAPVKKVPDGRWITPHDVDPFTIPIEQKAELLFKTNEEALSVKGVRFVNSSMNSARTAGAGTTEGSMIQQTSSVWARSQYYGHFCRQFRFQTRNAPFLPRLAAGNMSAGCRCRSTRCGGPKKQP